VGKPRSRTTALLDAIIETVPVVPKSQQQDLTPQEDQVSSPRGQSDSVPLYLQHPLPTNPCQTFADLPVGFAVLCYSGEISRSTIMILQGTRRLLPHGTIGNARWFTIFPWGEDDPRFGSTTAIDMLLLQGLLAFSIQNGFEPSEGVSSLSTESIRARLVSISESELTALAEDTSIRDALVWIHLSVVGGLHTHATDEDYVQNYAVLLDRVFLLFPNPRHLWWKNIFRTLQKFWFPAHLHDSWKTYWTKRLTHWRTQKQIKSVSPPKLGWGMPRRDLGSETSPSQVPWRQTLEPRP
jgi:hypothetical protein